MRMLKPALIAIAVAIMAAPAMAQVPRTKSGHPDLNGIWTNASLTPLSRAKPTDKLVVNEAEATKIAGGTSIAGIPADDPEFNSNARYSDPNKGAPAKGGSDFGLKGYDSFWVTPGTRLAVVKGEYRTSNIVEPATGQLPYKNPAAVQKAQQAGFIKYLTGNDPYIGPESTTLSERCLIGFGQTGGPGMLSVLYNNNYQFVLTDEHLMILVEMAHDARVIPLFASAEKARAGHRPNAIKPWFGDSVGWWDGDTLVVETVNVNPKQAAEQSFALSAKGTVTERFTRTGEKDIFYEFSVNDPDTYTQSWKAEMSFYPQSRLYEYACHEGNYGLHGILAGARLKEQQAEAAAKSKGKPAKGGQ
ncbi:MAG: hypothetical protein Q8R02_24475 [Hyphomonadaceae bacterium]|nr:hypothetical protein [Hyphomonadaceae bacterium]